MLQGRRAECAAIDRLLADAANLRSGALVLRGETTRRRDPSTLDISSRAELIPLRPSDPMTSASQVP